MVKIKTSEDLVDKGHKYGFLVLVLGQTQYGKVIGNEAVQWTTSEYPRGYNENIQAKDMAFNRSKIEKKMKEKLLNMKNS